MPAPAPSRSSGPGSTAGPTGISRREWLAGAGAGAAALLLEQGGVRAQQTPAAAVVFSHTRS